MYQRVIPRDLFNESKLLKCLGRLALLIHDGRLPGVEMEHDGEAFIIDQREDDGGLTCETVRFSIQGEPLTLFTAYNSRAAYPLFCETTEMETLAILNDDGTPTAEFMEITTAKV
jgi:hypothetical protein